LTGKIMTNKNFEGDDKAQNGGDNSQGANFGANQDKDQRPNGGDEGANNSGDSDVQKLRKRLDDSQAFIDTLKSERQADRQVIDELQNKLKSVPTIDEILEQVNRSTGGDRQEIDQGELINKAAEIFESRLNAKEIKQKQDANFKEVSSALKEALGKDGLNEKVAQLAEENGMSFDDFVRMAETSPKAALKLAGVEAPKPQRNPTESDVNTYAYDQNGTKQPIKRKHITDMTTERERVAYLNQRFKEKGLIK
jgi:hypothetical protein